MAELSFFARLVLTLLLFALSLFVYKWLQTPCPFPSSAAVPPKRSKKRSKKKPANKSVGAESVAPPPQSLPFPPTSIESRNVPMAAAAALTGTGDDGSASDSDDGGSAAQVLAKRKFKPTSLGGSRLARQIKASLISTDTATFAVDENVLARYRGGERWFPATVLEQRKGNAYHLKYDDGEVEFRVPAKLIKPRPATSDADGDKEESDTVPTAEAERVAAAVQSEVSGSDSSASDDDGWQVVGTSRATKRHARRLQTTSRTESVVDGLTKRQRENRRKKERQREKKELLREQAQKDDLDARARWRYVPS